MIRNYFKTASRNLLRHKGYTIINIAGLAIGIAVCVAMYIIIQFQSSFEDFHKKKDRIYRLLTEYHHTDVPVFYSKGVPQPLPVALKTNFSQIEKIATVYTEGNDQILVLDDNGIPVKKFKEEQGVFFTEPSLFAIFDFKWLAGNASSLKDPNTAVLTKDIAEKYFGDWQTAVGKTIKWNNNAVLKITGILENVPANTDLQFKVVIAYGSGYTADFAKSTDWDSTSGDFGCYLLLPSNISEASFNTQLRAFVKKMKSADNKDSHIIQPLTDVHYDTETSNFSGQNMSHEFISALWLIAAFILLIACINFINLSTAQAVNRAKEVGVRKVLGSNKIQLQLQFITETFLIVFIAVLLAVIIILIVLPSVGNILDMGLSFNAFKNPALFLFLFLLAIVVTALAGFYPSLILSSFNPVNALKSKLAAKRTRGISLRRGLVVFQFVIAQSLIIGTFIILKQMNYFTNQPLGFDKEAIVNIPFSGDSISTGKLDYLRKQLSGIKGVESISFSSNTPVEDDNDNWTSLTFDRATEHTDFYSIIKFSDHEYLPTYHLPLVAGRNVHYSDTAKEFLVNELLLKNLGITNPQDALNKGISIYGGEVKGNIVGVLKDFNARSFRRDLAPVLMTTIKREYDLAGIKLASNDVPGVLKAIEKIWNQTFPDFVFEYQFLDEKVAGFYEKENQLSQLYEIFAGIAIFLSCLGLYGLASFMAVQRIKEVGIRKVLGATSANIVYLFSKEFVILIAIAFVIATPIAWYYMHQWLQDYVYKIDISLWMFLSGGIVSIIIALLTVSFQAIKAAVANPVKSLRTE